MKRLVLLAACTWMTGCATIFGSNQDMITVRSKDPEAVLSVNGNEIGKGEAAYPVKRGSQATVTASKKGCSDRTTITQQSVAGISFLNLLNPIAWIIDAASGKMHKTDPTDYMVSPACP